MPTNSKNNTPALHATLAREIKAAKKTLFKRHREGMPLRDATTKFVVDIANQFHDVVVPDHESPTVNDKGVELFSDIVDEAKLDERDRVQGEVNSMLTFFDSSQPEFINDAVVDAIGRACEHFGIDEPEYEVGYEGQTRDVLTQLFAKTKMLELRDIETPLSDLSWAISTIVKSPIAPERLRRDVGDFATDINELDESPEGIEKALGFGVCGYGGCPGTGDPLNPCPGPDAEGNHKTETEDEEDDDDGVTVTLPNGKEVTLHGDAADMAKEPPSGNQKVLRALSELLHNPQTPSGLFEAVAEFVCEQSNEVGLGGILHSAPVLIEILKTVKPEDTRGALCARIAAEFGAEKEASHAATTN